MTNEAPFSLRPASWEADRESLGAVRIPVFVDEQAVPADMEWDPADETAFHLLAEDRDGNPIGTARLLPDGRIGRMAVLRPWRGRGVGSALLRALLQRAREHGYPPVFLSAQLQAMPFYARHGFEPLGETFMEAGIPHRQMRLADPAGSAAGPVELQHRDAFLQHGIQMLRQASRSLEILTHDLDPALYDQGPFVDALKRLATASHQSRIRILLEDNDRVQKQGHRVLELARRLPSRIAIHRPAADHQEQGQNFLIADRSDYLLQRMHTPYQGEAGYRNRRQARRLGELFDQMWEHSEPDRALRRLYI